MSADAKTDPKDDDDMTPEQRMAWLRERGVVVETPEERKAKTVANVMKESDEATAIPYVLVPADASKPLQELSFAAADLYETEGDALEKHLRPAFGGDREAVDLGLLQQQQQPQQLLGSTDSPVNVSREALQEVAARGNVEIFRLVHPSPSNQFVGVFMYLDEVGMLKRLPLNSRASEYARRAGFEPPPTFHGDVFLARVQTKPRLRHLPFVLGSDSAMDADWLQRAAMENMEWQMEQNRMTGRQGELQPTVEGGDGIAKQEEGYQWTQTEEELEVVVPLPDASSSKDVNIKFRPQSLQVSFRKEVFVLLELFERIDPDGCTWTLERGDGDTNKLIVTMEKVEQALWPRIRN